MDNKSLVKLSNAIGVISIILLIYWIFVFISITVFELKVFKKNITETFYLSVVGILALMFGSLIINVMFNLTRIAEKHNQDNMNAAKRINKQLGLLFGLSFPIVFGLLWGGDYLSSKKKEKMLIDSAKSIIESNKEKSDKLLNYSFSENWMIETDAILDLYSKTDKHFLEVSVIVADSIDHSPVFLNFRSYGGNLNDTIHPTKKNFIQETTQEEREYLKNVFSKDLDKVRFSANDDSYELFFPYIKDQKKVVLYFSTHQHQHFGGLGS
jgi:hypothetical protein